MGKEEIAVSDIEKTEMKNNVDRLSNLSDDLIITILSFLTANEISQTCILSKRWCKLWAYVPCLCFNIIDRYREIEFVSNFLLKRDGATDTDVLRILCNNSYDNSHVAFDKLREWIIYAVEHNVKIFELAFPIYDWVPEIPNCLFTCKTLEDLKIYILSMHEVIKPSTVYLPRLRNLYLIHVELHEEKFQMILSGCPVLENFDVRGCNISMSRISSHNAKQLAIHVDYIGHEMSISATSAETLILSTQMGNMITLRDLPKVSRAIISIYYDMWDNEEYSCNLLSGLSNVEKLDIASCCSKEFLGLRKCPTFHGLKVLFIHELSARSDFDAWSYFIKHCPNLEELYLDPGYEFWPGESRDQMRQSLKQIEGFPCKGLKKVSIVYTNRHRLSNLVELIKLSTKEIGGVEIALVKNGYPQECMVLQG